MNYAPFEDIISVFSHELVEILTDPEPDLDSGQLEIVDACFQQTGLAAGHKVQAYFSDRHKACIVPADRLQRACSLSMESKMVGLPPVPISEGNNSPEHKNALCFSGSYHWNLFAFAQEAVIKVDVSSYTDPEITWHIDDLPSLSGTSPTIVTRPVNRFADPLAQLVNLPESTANIVVQANYDALTIKSTWGQGHVDLYIECIVKETGIPNEYGSVRRTDGSMSITGSFRVMEDRFWKDFDRCKHELKRKALEVALYPPIEKGDPPPVWVDRKTLGLDRDVSIETNEVSMLGRMVADALPAMSQELESMAVVIKAKSMMTKIEVEERP